MKPRVAAILSADADGFARLASEDEATAERVRDEARATFEKQVAQRGGRLAESAPGAVLAAFGSALDAALCATGVQRELEGRNAARPARRRLHWRVGVAFGAVEGEEDSPAGDAVEAAAQMEMLSEPGGVCVTQSVWEQVAARIDVRFEPLPHAVLAGSAWRGFRAALRRPEGAVR